MLRVLSTRPLNHVTRICVGNPPANTGCRATRKVLGAVRWFGSGDDRFDQHRPRRALESPLEPAAAVSKVPTRVSLSTILQTKCRPDFAAPGAHRCLRQKKYGRRCR